MRNVLLIAVSTKVSENSSSVLHTVCRASTNCNLECLDVNTFTLILGFHLYPRNVQRLIKLKKKKYIILIFNTLLRRNIRKINNTRIF